MPNNKPTPVTMDAVYTAPGYLFRRMQQIAVALFIEECKAFDLTPVQYAALVTISTHPGIDATRLSAVIAFDRSTLGNVIERLQAKEFIVRKPAPEDKRVKLLYLTKAGAAVLSDIMIASTCLAVLFVPAFFVVVQSFENWRKAKKGKTAPQAAPQVSGTAH